MVTPMVWGKSLYRGRVRVPRSSGPQGGGELGQCTLTSQVLQYTFIYSCLCLFFKLYRHIETNVNCETLYCINKKGRPFLCPDIKTTILNEL